MRRDRVECVLVEVVLEVTRSSPSARLDGQLSQPEFIVFARRKIDAARLSVRSGEFRED